MKSRAFTLIELLVVIAIIAILAAILFPVFAQAKAAAKNAASLSNNKQITLGAIMYQNDFDDMVPMGAYSMGPASPDPTWWTWGRSVYPYLKNTNILYSPLGGPHAVSGWMVIFSDPNYNWIGNWQYFFQYGLNVSWLNAGNGLCNDIGVTNADGSFNVFGPPKSATSVPQPANTVYFADSGEDAPETNVGSYIVYAPGTFTAADVCTYEDWGIKSTGFYFGNTTGSTAITQAGAVYPRAAGGATVSYVDGHAKNQQRGSLAKGTDWALGQNEGQSVILDRSQYQWGAPN